MSHTPTPGQTVGPFFHYSLPYDGDRDLVAPGTPGAVRLHGTVRDHVTHQRRPFVRFFACERDISLEPSDARLPDSIASGAESAANHFDPIGRLRGEEKQR